MIEVTGLQKSFEDIKAIDQITARIEEGHVFGLIGTNGAGKSTFLRLLCGVLKADRGQVLVDGAKVYDNPRVKAKFFYISDEMFFFKNGTPRDMARLYETYYPSFDRKRFEEMLVKFGLDAGRRVDTFSKGMKKQLAVLCGICAGVKYLLCDETFDGLDPVMRRQIWNLLLSERKKRGMTVLVSSHNLRELEEVCDYVGIMHQGRIRMERSLQELQGTVSKIQTAFEQGVPVLPETFQVLHMSNLGRVYTMIVKGDSGKAREELEKLHPLFVDVLPLTLEEIFIYELGGADYAVKDIVL